MNFNYKNSGLKRFPKERVKPNHKDTTKIPPWVTAYDAACNGEPYNPEDLLSGIEASPSSMQKGSG